MRKPRKRPSHCIRGHNLDDPENVRLDGRGVRRCKQCARIHLADQYKRHVIERKALRATQQ